MNEPVKTIAITNFNGRLTRIINGEMNSGFAKFTTSWGYDPFNKPMNLTWLPSPNDITGPIKGLVVAAKTRFEFVTSSTVGTQNVYALTNNGTYSNGNLFKIQASSPTSPVTNSVVAISSVSAGSPIFNNGGSLEFFQYAEGIYVGSDYQINEINFDGSGDKIIGFPGQASTFGYIQDVQRPLQLFDGKLMLGNGQTVAAIDNTNLVTSSIFAVSSILGNGNHAASAINPALPADWYVQDLDISPDFNYLLITATRMPPEKIGVIGADVQPGSSADAAIFMWNGSDLGITAGNTLPSGGATGLQTYLQKNVFFGNDTFGSYVNDGTNKLLTLPNNKAPYRNAIGSNGNFLFWIAPEEVIIGNGPTYQRVASMYYFGSLDEESAPGLFRVMRYTTSLANGSNYQAPVNILVNNDYTSFQSSGVVEHDSFGTHYFSVFDVSSSDSQTKLYSFCITPSYSFNGVPQKGVYETQNQLFSKRIGLAQIRVYTEPTATGNGFQLDLIGTDGNVITNGTFTYSYGSVLDPSTGQASMERINFNPSTKTLFSVGVRITNTGNTNMTIKKVEIDYTEEGK